MGYYDYHDEYDEDAYRYYVEMETSNELYDDDTEYTYNNYDDYVDYSSDIKSLSDRIYNLKLEKTKLEKLIKKYENLLNELSPLVEKIPSIEDCVKTSEENMAAGYIDDTIEGGYLECEKYTNIKKYLENSEEIISELKNKASTKLTELKKELSSVKAQISELESQLKSLKAKIGN